MISNYENDVSNGLIFLVDENGNEMISKTKEGKIISNPKPLNETYKNSETFKNLKQFYQDYTLNLNFKNMKDLPKNVYEIY